MSNQITQFDIITISSAAIILLVTNTWNTLIKDIINRYFPQDNNKAITAQILYTLTLTFVLGIIVYLLQKYGTDFNTQLQKFINSFSYKLLIKIPSI